MDPFTIAAIASAGLQGVLGLGQLVGGSLMKPQRPTYQIPDEIKNMLALRQMNLQGRMAGASQAQRNILQSQGSTIGAYQGTLRNPNAILAGVSASQGQTNRAFTDLASMEAQDYQRRLAGLEGAQRTMANYRDQAFQINEMQPYQDESRTKAALIGAGLRNVAGAGQAVTGAFGEAAYMKQLQEMYRQKTQPTTTEPQEVGPLGYNMATPIQPTGVSGQGFEVPMQGQTGVEALMSNMAFNDWIFRTTGKNSTEFTPTQLAYFRSQFRG